MKEKSIKLNFIMNVILRMSAFIFPLITFPYVIRTLGAIGNGKIKFATSLVGYFTMIASLGIPTYGVRVCAQCRDQKEQLSKTVHELLMISGVTTLISYLALVGTLFTVPMLAERKTVILITSVSIILSTFGMEWFYQAIEEYTYITVRNLLFKILSVILMFVLVKSTEDYVVYAGICVLGTVGSNIFNMLRIRKYIFLKKLGNYNVSRHIRPIFAFFMLSVATTIYTNLDAVMLGFMSGDEQVGYYDAAVKMKSILLGLVTALGAVLLPRASYYVENGLLEEFRKIIKKSFSFIFAMAVPISVFFVIESLDTLMILSKGEYREATLAMQVITPTILFIGLTQIIGIQVMVPLKMEKYTTLSTVFGAVVDLVLNILLIPGFGAAGAAMGTLAAEAVVLVVQVWFMLSLKKGEYLSQDVPEFIKIIISTGMAAVGMVLLKGMVGNLVLFGENSETLNLLLQFCILGMIFFGIYLLGLLFMKSSLLRELGK